MGSRLFRCIVILVFVALAAACGNKGPLVKPPPKPAPPATTPATPPEPAKSDKQSPTATPDPNSH
jgi:predicted small lipoprotein YifL